MSDAKPDRNNYDIASISRTGQEKRTNHVRQALFMEKSQKTTGTFVSVFADIFLKREAGQRSYI
jgi:polyisoprenoid-binding protein YceI